MKSRSLLFILGLIGHYIFAQNYVDIARLYYNSTTLNRFENSASETRVNEMGIDLTYPIVLKNDNAFLTGLTAERTQVKLGDSEGYTNVSSFALRVGLNKKHSEKWSGTYMLIPKLSSDFKTSSEKNFQFGILGLLRYTKSDRMNYKIGLFYNSELFGPFLVPLLGLYYLGPDEKFEANLTLPNAIDINYKLHKAVTAGFNFTSLIRSYRLSEVGSSGNPGYLRKASNEPSVYLKFNFTKNISLQGRVGYTIGRTYRVYNENDKIDLGIMFVAIGDNRTQLNTNFSDGLIYQTVLLYRFVRD